MKQDTRTKTARVAAVLAMSKARGYPVTRQAAETGVAFRMEDAAWVARCYYLDKWMKS